MLLRPRTDALRPGYHGGITPIMLCGMGYPFFAEDLAFIAELGRKNAQKRLILRGFHQHERRGSLRFTLSSVDSATGFVRVAPPFLRNSIRRNLND